MIESCKHFIIIQIDHFIIIDIMKQSSITFITFIVRINTRLICVSQFLRQFRFEVRYKPGKKHIMLNALSRFVLIKPSAISKDHSKFNALHVDYNYSFI